VNDPSTARVPRSGARNGVVHVLGSLSTLIGTTEQGGTERRPVDDTSTMRNSIRAEHVAGKNVRPVLVAQTLLTRVARGG
jgi:hypothetical protein